MKKKAIIISSILIAGSVIEVTALQAPQSGGAVDSPLIQEVDHQGQVLNNHEARITNTENNVKDIQSKTSTPPSTTQVSIPQTTATPTTPVVASQVTIISFEVIPISGSEDQDCKYVYTDGSTKQFAWQRTIYNQGTKITQTSGYCDGRVIGQIY